MLNALTEQSGSGVRFWSMAKELAREGHSLCFLERSIAKNGRSEAVGIRYRSTVETGLLWLDIFRATLLNLLHGLIFRPDYVFALKPMPNTCIPALFLKKISKCKIIVDIDDLDFEYYPDDLRRKLLRLLFKLFPRHFDVITTHNRNLRDFIINELQISPEKIHFLPQGIEARIFLKAQPDECYREKWGINPNDQVIVYCASLGITSDFLQIFPMLVDFLRSSAEVKILVIGGGTHRQYYVKQIEAYGLQERIILTGYVPHGDMPGIFKLARVGINYMAPTWANKCRASIKIREYLAAGLSVVCNTVGEAELFKDYVTLCSSVEEFPAAMRQALIRQNLDISRRGQEFVERSFSWSPLVKGFVEHLERVAP
jgi:glycosyltransferase involved in cell wall biosynthesis